MLRRALVAGGLVVALLAAGCSSTQGGGSSSASASRSGTASEAKAGSGGTAASAAALAAPYRGGLDGFYRVPSPLPHGAPGQLIRVQPIGTTGGHTSVRVMYHSVDGVGHDRAVTGVITYPTTAPPAGGWAVISTAHGTTGISTQCAPSRTTTAAPGWGVDGVWAETDYIGLGPIGEEHAYLSKVDEGNAVIDIVRAARNLPAAHAGARWVAVGHSQGGHGALAAFELAAAHAPELHLVATVALAPAAMLDKVYGGIDPIVTAILTMMALHGARAEYPQADLDHYLSPTALAASKVFDTGCLDAITNALIGVVMGGAWTNDPRQTEPARSMILANDVGEHRVPGVALLLASGTSDDRVVIDRFRDLTSRICATGQPAEIHVVPGATHDSVIAATRARVTAFIAAALAGHATPDSCTKPPSTWSTGSAG